MTGEVSTIHRGYVFGIERAEVTRVIPVIEVTTETLEAVHRSERGFEPLDCATVPSQPKSCAAMVERRYSPRLVGDVRWATVSALPENYREEGRGLPGRQRSRRTARFGARLTAACECHLPREAEPSYASRQADPVCHHG